MGRMSQRLRFIEVSLSRLLQGWRPRYELSAHKCSFKRVGQGPLTASQQARMLDPCETRRPEHWFSWAVSY